MASHTQTFTQTSTLSGPQDSVAELAKRKPRLVVFPPNEAPRAFALGARNLFGRGVEDGLTINDPRLSRSHAELVRNRSVGTFEVCDLGSKNGTFVNGVRVARRVLVNNDVIRVGNTLAIFEERVPSEVLNDTTRSGATFLMESAAGLAAQNDRPVLLLGQSGAGKTRLAAKIAAASSSARPYVHVNCGALQPSLVDSELFGHAAGAFTGASGSRAGLIESANGGTLFLDEIGTIALDLQARLLTCIESGRIRRVGENQERTVKVRFIAATNANVDRAVAEGTFREDLLFRLQGNVIVTPSLTERRVDIANLCFEALGARDHRVFEPMALEALLLFEWPGNVRQLNNMIASAQRSDDGIVGLAGLPATLLQSQKLRADAAPVVASTSALPPSERELRMLLTEHHGNLAEVARKLNAHRTQVVRWCRYQGLDPESFRRR
jgi:two-component system response regulator GlrR